MAGNFTSSALVGEPEPVNICEASDVSPTDGWPVPPTVALKIGADAPAEGEVAVILGR